MISVVVLVLCIFAGIMVGLGFMMRERAYHDPQRMRKYPLVIDYRPLAAGGKYRVVRLKPFKTATAGEIPYMPAGPYTIIQVKRLWGKTQSETIKTESIGVHKIGNHEQLVIGYDLLMKSTGAGTTKTEVEHKLVDEQEKAHNLFLAQKSVAKPQELFDQSVKNSRKAAGIPEALMKAKNEKPSK